MIPYIDVEKLITEIESIRLVPQISADYNDGRDDMKMMVLDLIDSLQQEQPKKNKNCSVCPHCVDRKDQNGWHFKGCFGGPYKGKFIAEIEECPLQQEQPEVELEKFDKDVTEIWGKCAAEPNDSIACIHIETFNEVARHFYELGINARKEESK